MDTKRLELQQDLSEVDKLLAKANRNYVKETLVKERVRIMRELSAFNAPVESSEQSEVIWKAIDQFSWDQKSDLVIIYVTCFSEFDAVSKENVKIEFTQNSFCVSVYGYKKANYRLRIPKLTGNIKEAKVSIKPNGFSVKLKKKELFIWQNLVPKSPTDSVEMQMSGNEVDVSENLSKLMKELYEEGNAEMKQLLESRGYNKTN